MVHKMPGHHRSLDFVLLLYATALLLIVDLSLHSRHAFPPVLHPLLSNKFEPSTGRLVPFPRPRSYSASSLYTFQFLLLHVFTLISDVTTIVGPIPYFDTGKSPPFLLLTDG